MLLFSILVAGSFSLGSRVAPQIDPATFNALRFAVATLAVGLVAMFSGALRVSYFRRSWRYVVLGGLFAAYFVSMFEGLKTAPPVSAAAIFTLTPVMAAAAAWWLLRQRLTPWIALALSVGAVGALWVIFRADLAALLAFEIGRGEAIFFAGCMGHAIYTPAVRYLNRGEPVLAFTFGTLLATSVILVVWSALNSGGMDWSDQPPLVWVTLIYTALFASSMTVFLIQFATMRLPSSKVMAYTYLTPSVVILWEVALGAGAPPVWILAGIGLTVAALLMLLREDAGT